MGQEPTCKHLLPIDTAECTYCRRLITGTHAPCDSLETVRQLVRRVIVAAHGLGQQVRVAAVTVLKRVGEVNGIAITAQVVTIAGIADGLPCSIHLFVKRKPLKSALLPIVVVRTYQGFGDDINAGLRVPILSFLNVTHGRTQVACPAGPRIRNDQSIEISQRRDAHMRQIHAFPH